MVDALLATLRERVRVANEDAQHAVYAQARERFLGAADEAAGIILLIESARSSAVTS